MPKKETIFPDSSFGGRIQKMRMKKGMSKLKLHETIYPENPLDDNSKRKTVYNWESGKNFPNYDDLKKMCELFNCDSDYLLGLQNTPLKCTSDVMEVTGLSERATMKICSWSKENADYTSILNRMLENDYWISELMDSVRHYLMLKTPVQSNYRQEIKEIVKNDQNRAMNLLEKKSYSELAVRFIALKSNLDENDISELFLQSAKDYLTRLIDDISKDKERKKNG